MRLGLEVRCLGQNRRGFEHYTRNLLAALKELNPPHEIFLYTDRAPADAVALPFPLRVVPRRGHSLWWLNRQLPAAAATDRLGLMHFTANEVWLPRAIPAAVTFHDAGTMLNPRAFAAGLKARLHFRLLRHLLRRADGLVTVSAAAQRDIARFLALDPARITVTYEGIDARYFLPVADAAVAELRARLRLPPRFVLFVSALDRRKNILGAVRAMLAAQRALADPLPLVVAGETLSGAGARYLSPDDIRRETGCGDTVIFIGRVGDADMAALYRAARCLLLPSYYEGFGLPYIEAQACGTPVIAASTTSGPEVVGDSGLLAAPDDHAALADAVRRLASDDALHAALRARGLANAQRFTGAACARRLVAVWENILSRRTAA